MKPKPANTYHHGDLRQALIEAGAALAADNGVAAVKTSTLARQLGVSSAAPFRHFKSREALLVAIAEAGADLQLAAMQAAVDPSAPPHQQQRAMGVAYVRWCVAHPGYFRVLSRRESLEGSARVRAQSELHLQQMDADFESKRDNPAAQLLTGQSAAVLAARSLVYGLARMCVDGLLGDIDPPTAARLAHEVTGVLGRGIDGHTP